MRLLRLCLWLVVVAVLGYGVSVLMEHQGSVQITWMGYEIRLSFAVLAVTFIAVVIGCAVLVSLIERVMVLPSYVRHQRESSRHEQGLEAITLAFASLAAADVQAADKYTRKAQGLLGDIPLLDLLGAQVAHKQGNIAQTHVRLEKLSAYKPTCFMANRALAGLSLRAGDAVKALEYAQAASQDKPHQISAQVTTLGLLMRTLRWQEAERLIFQARLRRHISSQKVQHYYALLYFAKVQHYSQMQDVASESVLLMAKKAHDHEHGFIPAARKLAELYAEHKDYRRAFKTLERAWKLFPHPELVDSLLLLSAHETDTKREKRAGIWVAFHPNAVASHVLQARLALDARRYEDAKFHLKSALQVAEDGDVLRMLAQVEHKQNPSEQGIRAASQWLERATHAHAAPVWVCGACGRVHDVWQLYCGACDSFDSIAWRKPEMTVLQDDSLQLLT